MLSATLEPVSQSSDLSHMPFLFRDGNDLVLVFAWSRLKPRRVPQYSLSGTTRIWSLMWRIYHPQTETFGPAHHLHTGLEANEVACSACVSRANGEIHLSFIGTSNHGTGHLQHHLFRMSGPSLERLSPAVRVASGFCGFWRPDLTATATGKDGRFELAGLVQGHLATSFAEMDRLSFDPDHPWQLLITGTLPQETSPRTIVYHAGHGVVLGELQVAGTPVYKPALGDGILAHPQQVESRHREAWRLAFTTHFAVVPTEVTVAPI